MRSPPPSKITAEVWEEAKGKLKTHADAPPPSVDAKSWHPIVAQGGHGPILISSVWIKLISRLLLKEAGAPLKELIQNVQFGVGVPHGGLALLTKVRSHLHKNPPHAAAQLLDFQNAFGTMHRKACIEQLEKHINPQEPWFLATKTYGVAMWQARMPWKRMSSRLLMEYPKGILYPH